MDPQQETFPAPSEGIVLTHFITSRDVARSAAFYRDVLDGQVVFQGEPTAVKLANGWIIINVGGGPTDDKPDVILEPPRDPHRTSCVPEHPRRRHPGRLRRMAAQGRGVPHAPEAARG